LGEEKKTLLAKLSDGYDKDMSTQAAEVMRRKYPGVNIVGSTSKYKRGPEDDEKQWNL